MSWMLHYLQLFFMNTAGTERLKQCWNQYVSDDGISLQSIAMQISKVPGMKIPKREKKLITTDGMVTILAQPKETKIGVRDKTIMVLLYGKDRKYHRHNRLQ